MASFDKAKANLVILGSRRGLDLSDDAYVDLLLEQVAEAIVNYCNIDRRPFTKAIPEGLLNVWTNMALDYAAWSDLSAGDQGSDQASEDNTVAGAITSIREGDVTFGFGAQDRKSTGAAAADKLRQAPALDAILFDYQDQLNRHRRLVWTP